MAINGVIETFSGRQTWSQFQAFIAGAAVVSLGATHHPSLSVSEIHALQSCEYRPSISDSSYQTATIVVPAHELSKANFVPKTSFGKRLMALREAALAEGMRLLTTEEIQDEVARRRGELV
jgi:hypothetical protein